MSDSTQSLTGHQTFSEWMDHPKGRPLIEDVMAKMGIDEAALRQLSQIPVDALPGLSQGRFPESVVTELVLAANDGVMPELPDDTIDPVQRFADQTIIITGAASGIGLATLKRVVREGGRVIAVDMNAERLDEIAASIPGGRVVPVAGDITEDETVDAIMAAAGDSVQGLANVAGIMDGMLPLHEVSNEVWDRVMRVNVTGTFKISRAVLKLMLEAKSGSIVNVASQAALRGNAAGTAYGTSKHAIAGMTKSEAFLYGPHGIRINAVAPGGTATGIEGSFKSDFAKERMAPFLELLPPIATADEQAAAITWLLSKDSSHVNGVLLPTDGGWSVQ